MTLSLSTFYYIFPCSYSLPTMEITLFSTHEGKNRFMNYASSLDLFFLLLLQPPLFPPKHFFFSLSLSQDQAWEVGD